LSTHAEGEIVASLLTIRGEKVPKVKVRERGGIRRNLRGNRVQAHETPKKTSCKRSSALGGGVRVGGGGCVGGEHKKRNVIRIASPHRQMRKKSKRPLWCGGSGLDLQPPTSFYADRSPAAPGAGKMAEDDSLTCRGVSKTPTERGGSRALWKKTRNSATKKRNSRSRREKKQGRRAGVSHEEKLGDHLAKKRSRRPQDAQINNLTSPIT